MKIDITLKKDVPFVVCLMLDLTSYCDAWKAVQLNESSLKQLKETFEKNKVRTIPENDIKTAEDLLIESSNHFNMLRNDMIQSLALLGGQMHWPKVKKLLSTQCNQHDSMEHQLYKYLTQEDTDAPLPLALECLEVRFIEFMKNSIDAMLVNYFKSISINTSLKMEIQLSLEGPSISIAIRDNCGGFPEDYIANFSNIIQSNNRSDRSIKSTFKRFCFGGNGLGLLTSADLVLRGKISGAYEGYIKYDVQEGSTEYSISNNAESHGAEIMIKTPLKPFPRAEVIDKQSEPDLMLTLPPKRLRYKGSPSTELIGTETAVNKGSSDERLIGLQEKRLRQLRFFPRKPLVTTATEYKDQSESEDKASDELPQSTKPNSF